jgi:hypothetical protein
MKIAVEMGVNTMIFIPRITKVGFGHSKKAGVYTDTQH